MSERGEGAGWLDDKMGGGQLAWVQCGCNPAQRLSSSPLTDKPLNNKHANNTPADRSSASGAAAAACTTTPIKTCWWWSQGRSGSPSSAPRQCLQSISDLWV